MIHTNPYLDRTCLTFCTSGGPVHVGRPRRDALQLVAAALANGEPLARGGVVRNPDPAPAEAAAAPAPAASADPLSVPCSHCKARRVARCKTANGKPTAPHAQRVRRATAS